MSRVLKTIGVTMSLVLLGAGCSTPEISTLTPQQAAEGMTFQQGSEIVVRQTVLGLGGSFLNWFGEEGQKRTITIDEWSSGSRAAVSWQLATKVETEESKAARQAHDEEYANTPVGVAIPSPPEKEFIDVIREGTLVSTALGNGKAVLPPNLWPEGDTSYDTNSLIWLSADQYDELSNTRRTNLTLGLFDEQLSNALEITDNIRNLVNRFMKDAEESSDAEDLLLIEADPDWGFYTVLVDGVQTRVRTIEAKNVFGKYTVLANRANPLILEMVLTPASKGKLKLNPSGLLDNFVGYEVRELNNVDLPIIQTESSSEDQPQLEDQETPSTP